MNSSTGGSGVKKGMLALKWNSFKDHLSKGLGELYQDDVFADVTLACEGQFIKAHKFILSMFSPFLKKLFEANHDMNANTIVILNQVNFQDLEKIKTFIYQGKVNIAQSDLNRFLECAELLQVKGLTSFSLKYKKIEASANTNTNVNSSENFSHGNPSSSNNTTRKMPLRQNKQIIRSPPQYSASANTNKKMNSFIKQQKKNDDMTSSPLMIMNEQPVIDGNMKQEEGAGSSNNQDLIAEDYLEEDYEEYAANYPDTYMAEDGEITGTGPSTGLPVASNVNVGQWTGKTLKARTRVRAKPKSKLKKSGKMYRLCPYCSTQIYKSNMSRHIATLHTQILLEKGELFKCNICKQLYRNVGLLKLHMKRKHFGETSTSPQE